MSAIYYSLSQATLLAIFSTQLSDISSYKAMPITVYVVEIEDNAGHRFQNDRLKLRTLLNRIRLGYRMFHEKRLMFHQCPRGKAKLSDGTILRWFETPTFHGKEFRIVREDDQGKLIRYYKVHK